MGFQSRFDRTKVAGTLTTQTSELDRTAAAPEELGKPKTEKIGRGPFARVSAEKAARKEDLALRSQLQNADRFVQKDPAIAAIMPQLKQNLFAHRDSIEAAAASTATG